MAKNGNRHDNNRNITKESTVSKGERGKSSVSNNRHATEKQEEITDLLIQDDMGYSDDTQLLIARTRMGNYVKDLETTT